MKNNVIQTENKTEIYENEIYILCDEFVSSLPNPDAIYNNRNLINSLLKYLYKHYVYKVLNNTNRHAARYDDISILYDLWNVYINILGLYSNLRPTINQYCIFTNINKDTICNWNNNINRYGDGLTPEHNDFVKYLKSEIESDLLQGNTVTEIFQLKAIYGYNDNLAAIPLQDQARINSDNLPVLTMDTMPAIDTQTKD